MCTYRSYVVNSSRYSARPGTVASKYTRLGTKVVKERSIRLHQTIKKISIRRNLMWQGWKGKILIDELLDNSRLQGRNYAYKPVIVDLSKGKRLDPKWVLGQHLAVKVVETSNYSLLGELIF